MYDTLIKFAGTINELLALGVKAGMESLRTKLEDAMGIIKNAAAELHSKNQIIETYKCELDVTKRELSEVKRELDELKNK